MKMICTNCSQKFTKSIHCKSLCMFCGDKYRTKEEGRLRVNAQRREYYHNNKEKVRAQIKKWEDKQSSDYRKEMYKNWYSKPKNKKKMKVLMKKAYRKNPKYYYHMAIINKPIVRKKILEIVGEKCRICFSTKIQLHHKKYFFLPQGKAKFNSEMKKKIKKNIIPVCKKHHLEFFHTK